MTAGLTLLQPLREGTKGLDMLDQRLDQPFADAQAPPTPRQRINGAQIVLLLCPLALCITLLAALFVAAEPSLGLALLALAVVIPYYWDAVAATLAMLGLCRTPEQAATPAEPGLRVAMILTLYDSGVDLAISRSVQLLLELRGTSGHGFSLHVISDSRRPHAAERERAIVSSCGQQNPQLTITYRHRPHNTDYKSGNIRHWVTTAGHEFDAMLILDADSQMTAKAVLDLTNALAADPACAMVQTIPRVVPLRTRWQLFQSFASIHIGANLGRGLAMVSGNTGNFYGHNALLRIRAFASSCGLPQLPGERPFGGVIMSHDFVEAALLCRAGWHSRFMPDVSGSFEETPEALAGYLSRDQRWCQGNLQNLRLLGTPGLRPMSRFHLLQGAMSYLNAPLWIAAILLWPLLTIRNGAALSWFLLLVVATLLVPRICGFLAQANRKDSSKWPLACGELFMSALVAPSLIVQRTCMIASACMGRTVKWEALAPHVMSWSALLRFHVIELNIASLLLLTTAMGLSSVLVMAVALPLAASPLLAMYLSQPLEETPRSWL